MGLLINSAQVVPGGYNERLEVDSSVNDFAARVTASFCTQFALSGAIFDQLAEGGFVGAAYARDNRVVQEVVAFAATSGSGGVTRLDVLVQGTPGAAAFTSIFSNEAFKPALSSSLGNFGVARAGTFQSGSNTVWPGGSLLKVVAETAAGAAGPSGQKGVTVEVHWFPTGSYFND